MDFTLDTKEHRAAIDAAADALTRRRGVLPALAQVRIDALPDGVIRYRGTDLDFSIEVEVRGEVAEPGSICIPGHRLAEIARESDRGSKTRLRLEDGAVSLETGASRFRLASADADEYLGTSVGLPPEAPQGTLASDVLAAMAARVGWITAKEESRGILCGVLMETTPSTLRMVATNTRQVGVCEAPVPGLPEGVRCTVPPQLLAAAERHFKGRGPVTVTFGDTAVSMQVAGVTLTGRTLAGKYPNYAQILPRDPVATLQIPTATLLQAVRRIATVARERASKVVVCRAGGRMLRLWTTTPELGSAHDQLEVEVQGQPVTLGFNADMMADILDVVPAEEVRLRIHGPTKGILVDGRGDDPIRSMWLVMPLGLDEADLEEPDARLAKPPARLARAA